MPSTTQNPIFPNLFPAATTVRSTSGRTRTPSILSGTTFLTFAGVSTSSFPASKPSARALAGGASEADSMMEDASEEEKLVLRGTGGGPGVGSASGEWEGGSWESRRERRSSPGLVLAAGFLRG